MIASAPAAQAVDPPQVIVTYHVASTAVRSVEVVAWRDGLPTVGGFAIDASSDGDPVRVGCAPGAEIAVLFERDDGVYAVDGPFVCPLRDGSRQMDSRWRRTLKLRAPPDPSVRGDLMWLAETIGGGEAWPRCLWRSAHVECWGMPVDARGVLMFEAGDRVWWTVVTARGVRDFQSSAWGRLVIAGNSAASGQISATIARPAGPQADRQSAFRLATVALPDSHAVAIGPASLWVYGGRVPPSSWIELRADGAGPKYVPLDEVAHGPPGLPFWILFDEARVVDGIARAPQGVPAAGAVVTLFRLIDPVPTRTDGRQQPRRVFAGERICDESGAFRFEGLGDADYEIVAWHPQFGRGTVLVPRGGGSVTVRLESAGQVRGRVVAGGKPLAGVDVISLPDPVAYAQAADLTEVKGGDARTGGDGRFAVSTAPGGGGELRIGGGAYPIRRFPLPRAPLPIVDLGDIELGVPIEVTILLDRDPGCDLRATGPVGRAGLQVIGGSRTAPGLFRITFPEEGLWEVHLACGRDELALAPTVITITQGSAGSTLRFVVR